MIENFHDKYFMIATLSFHDYHCAAAPVETILNVIAPPTIARGLALG